ncbi:uncharacterized protein N7459_000879 [Penicillium hispanicum]|uniref:uncharacterized protein n=1 Tax=Penicillium hispanicum TaxID=1080232 RepID=UPI002540E2C9|nr:uncharacterized protein N7459_000879 [Penicillium hispanicum]KAJ5594671.1 hypothetical protein N7459_000879 [Penicillium hispanicum]
MSTAAREEAAERGGPLTVDYFIPDENQSSDNFSERSKTSTAAHEETPEHRTRLVSRASNGASIFWYLTKMLDCAEAAWSGQGAPDVQHMVNRLSFNIENITIHWGLISPDDAKPERLSKVQKRTIISSLKGFCVQEDWDVLEKLLSPNCRYWLLAIMLEALISKDIWRRFVTSPFWYLDGKRNEEDEEGDPVFGQQLKYLFERYMKTNPLWEAFWKTETLRLANSTAKYVQAPNTEFGEYHKRRCESLIEQAVDEWLLKGPLSEEQENRRRKELIRFYERASHDLAAMNTGKGYFKLLHLDRLDKTFSHTSERLLSHHSNAIDNNASAELDGRRILIVTHPAVIRQWSELRDLTFYLDEENTLSRAVVVIEDPKGRPPWEERWDKWVEPPR